MKFLQETTEWKVPTPNHTYIFDGSSTKIVGYVKQGTTVAVKFSAPLSFDRRGRTFEQVKPNGLDLSAFN